MPLDRSNVPPSGGTQGGASEVPPSFHRDSEHSPSSFRSSSSDPSRWSFPASQYRQSAILEMGSAIPMEVVNPNSPREIQLDNSRDSLAGMSSILNSLSSEHEFVRNLRKDGAKRPSRVLSDTSFSELERELDHSRFSTAPRARNSHYIPASVDSYENLIADESSRRDDSSLNDSTSRQLARPPRITAPLSPLTPLRHPAFQPRRRSESPSLTSASNLEDYITAHESVSDESSPPSAADWQPQILDARGSFGDRSTLKTDSLNTPWKAEKAEAEAGSEAGAAARKQAYLPGATKAKSPEVIPELGSVNLSRDYLAETGRNTWHDGYSDIQLHNRSFSEPSQRPHPLPAAPYDSATISSRKHRTLHFPRGSSIEHSMSTSLRSADSEVSNKSASRRTTSGQRRRGSDTVAPHLALKVGQQQQQQEQKQPQVEQDQQQQSSFYDDLEPTSYSTKPTRRHSEHKSHSKHEKSDKLRESRRHSAGSSKKRNFTKKSIENMLESTRAQLDIKDIGLPAPERRLLEKFVDTLSKLSIEVQMDEGKREEGLRRMHNALRALEGWI